MMGEQFSEPNFVVGIILKLKPQFDKISVWMRDSRNTDAVARTRQEMVKLLQIEDSSIEYMVFKEQKQKDSAIGKKFQNNIKKKGYEDLTIKRSDPKKEE